MKLEELSKSQRELINAIINTPQTENFIDAVKIEIQHHIERWGDESEKHPHDFHCVISYLNGKLIKSIWEKDVEKFEHHLITITAVCGTCHKYLKSSESNVNYWFFND